MATIKSYTTLEQSKKLAEILPLESADMCYKCIENDPYDIVCKPYSEWKEEYKGLLVRGDANVIPCWSLAVLLDVLPDNYIDVDDTIKHPSLMKTKDSHYMVIYSAFQYTSLYNNPIDACVSMIEKLHRLNLL